MRGEREKRGQKERRQRRWERDNVGISDDVGEHRFLKTFALFFFLVK